MVTVLIKWKHGSLIISTSLCET